MTWLVPKVDAGVDLLTSTQPFFPVELLNWSQAFPYKPKVEACLAYSQEGLHLAFRAEENAVRAVSQDDINSHPWEDSCVEFFLSPNPQEPFYYNFEFACNGFMLLGSGPGRHHRARHDAATTAQIKRTASLGSQAFGLRNEPTKWTLTAFIPWSVIGLEKAPKAGEQMKANFYKIGDHTPVPHYLSWAPITSPTPDFHRPEFFGTLIFQ